MKQSRRVVGQPPKPTTSRAANRPRGDLSPTALYTAQTWLWSGQSCAELFATPESRAVFRATSIALGCARLFRWGAPSLPRSLTQRHVMIDRLVGESGATQVLELAAGLSRRGAALSANPRLTYVEVDLPHVVERKRMLLEVSVAGQAILTRRNFRLVAGDVAEVALEELIKPDRPLFVIAEGLFMYLQPPEQHALWEKIAALFRVAGSGGFVFDLVPANEQPRPGVIGRGLEWLMKRFTGGRSFERDERTREDIAAQLVATGFPNVELFDLGARAGELDLPFADRRTQQLLFFCQSG